MPAEALTPLRVGVVLENVERTPDHPTFRGLALRAAEANSAGGVWGREIELVFEAADGAHHGLPETNVVAFRRLAADPTVIAIVGPGISDNCLPLCDATDRARVATINWSGTDEARGRWYFQFQWGSLTDESDFLVDLIAERGLDRIGVLRAGVVGDRYAEALHERARYRGVDVVASLGVHVHVDDVVDQVRRIRDAGPDALVFLGMGEPSLAFGRAVRALDWDVPRFANIAMLAVTLDPAAAAVNEGIIWTDQYDLANEQRRHVAAAHRDRYGEDPLPTGQLGAGYDMMTLLVEAMHRAPHPTRAGVLAGLERVRNLPAATGGPGTVMGFAPWERSALKGPDLFVFRTIRDGRPVPYER